MCLYGRRERAAQQPGHSHCPAPRPRGTRPRSRRDPPGAPHHYPSNAGSQYPPHHQPNGTRSSHNQPDQVRVMGLALRPHLGVGRGGAGCQHGAAWARTRCASGARRTHASSTLRRTYIALAVWQVGVEIDARLDPPGRPRGQHRGEEREEGQRRHDERQRRPRRPSASVPASFRRHFDDLRRGYRGFELEL